MTTGVEMAEVTTVDGSCMSCIPGPTELTSGREISALLGGNTPSGWVPVYKEDQQVGGRETPEKGRREGARTARMPPRESKRRPANPVRGGGESCGRGANPVAERGGEGGMRNA